ncbi:hypothetical protein V1282_006006 [Nitrobacteraceae bacterium AZCC 2146]
MPAPSSGGIALSKTLSKTLPKTSTRRFTAILITGALASKVLGFGREVLMAKVLGASLVADGFRGATAAVLIPLAFLQNESVPAVMIPMHRDALKGDHAPQSLAALTVALGAVSVVLALIIEALGGFVGSGCRGRVYAGRAEPDAGIRAHHGAGDAGIHDHQCSRGR